MISVAIVGLGRIGAGYDSGKDSALPRSHLGAVIKDKNFKISALIDPNPEAFSPWKGRISEDDFFSSIESWNGNADVIVFASPPNNRVQGISGVLSKNPKIIVLEKPMAQNFSHAQEIYTLLQQSTTKSVVNFHRRYDPHYVAVREAVTGVPEKIICRYGKGLDNYASHHIDLIQYWFGDFASVQTLTEGDNPDFTAQLKSGARVVFLGVEKTQYDVFDMDIFFSGRHVRIDNGGCDMSVRYAVPDLYYPSYTHLGEQKPLREAGQVSGMTGLYADIADVLSGQRGNLRGTTLEESLRNMQIIDAVRASQEDGRMMTL